MSFRILSYFLIFFLSARGYANYVGNDTQNFNPTPSGLDFVTVHSSQVMGYGILNGGFFINQASNSLPDTYNAQGDKINSDDKVIFGDLSAAYGFFKNFEIGLNLSYLLDQKTDRNQPGAQFSDNGLNEIRLLGKYLFHKGEKFGFAGVTSINFNETRNNPFAGIESGPTVNFEGVVDYRIQKFLLAMNLGYRIRDNGKAISGAVFEPLPDQFIGSLASSYYFEKADIKLIAELFAAQPMKDVAYVKKGRTSSELLFGAKYDKSDSLSMHFGAGSRVSDGLFTPDWRVYAGLNYTWDAHKHKTSTPEPTPAVTPTPIVNMYKGYLPEDIEALKAKNFDDLAKKHEFNLRTTVPTDLSAPKPPFEIIRLENFDFDFGSAKIRDEYHPMLNRLAEYLATEPKVIKIRIEGHTDSIGSLERNRLRSQQRADALKAYLNDTKQLSHIEIEAVGFGASRPISDNGNFQGRKENRRVEIRILRRLPPAPSGLKKSGSD